MEVDFSAITAGWQLPTESVQQNTITRIDSRTYDKNIPSTAQNGTLPALSAPFQALLLPQDAPGPTIATQTANNPLLNSNASVHACRAHLPPPNSAQVTDTVKELANLLNKKKKKTLDLLTCGQLISMTEFFAAL